jgi:ribosome maturation factor RimP
MTASRARLDELLGPVVSAAGCELEDVSVAAAGRRSVVRVVVDREGGISLDDVAEASKVVSAALDELEQTEPDVLGGSYVLEVTSPGVDRPLTAPRHWRRNVGRLVKAVRREGGDLTGRVVGADADTGGAVQLDVDGEVHALPYATLARGLVQVEFSRSGKDSGTRSEEEAR